MPMQAERDQHIKGQHPERESRHDERPGPGAYVVDAEIDVEVQDGHAGAQGIRKDTDKIQDADADKEDDRSDGRPADKRILHRPSRGKFPLLPPHARIVGHPRPREKGRFKLVC
ncbi:MAG: hypothetical protein V1745_02375 [Patescibacteria group bacterium]